MKIFVKLARWLMGVGLILKGGSDIRGCGGKQLHFLNFVTTTSPHCS